MAERYKIQVGNEIIEFEGPDGLTDRQIEDLADQKLKTAKPGESFEHSVYQDANELPELVGGSVRQEDLPESSAGGSFARGLPKDATFNWGDELAALGNAGIPGLAELDNATGIVGDQQGPLTDGAGGFWDRFHANMAASQAQAQADEEQHPVASGVGRVAGVVGTLPLAAEAGLARLPVAAREFAAAHPILSTTAAGGIIGGISGAGAGEGNRGQSAAIGTLTGAGLGPASYAVGELIPIIARYGRAIFKQGVTREAIGQLVKTLQMNKFDVTSPAGVQKLKAALQEYTGKPVSLADISSATGSRVGVGLRTPSDVQQTATDAILARQAGQGMRLSRDIRTNVAPRSDVHALEEDLIKQRREEAVGLRDRALFEDAPLPPPMEQAQVVPTPSGREDAGVLRTLGEGDYVPDTYSREMVPVPEGLPTTGRMSRSVDDDTLQRLARIPLAQKALPKALEMAENERIQLATEGLPTDHLPDMTPGANLDLRTFDYLKRFLDKQVDTLYKRGATDTFAAGEAAQVRALRDSIRERLRSTVPEYADYLDQYAGSSKMIDALREGQTFRSLDPEEITAGQAGRSTAAQEMYRVGASRNLLDAVMDTRDTAVPASRILNSPGSREQVAALGIPPENAAALNRSVDQERTLSLLNKQLPGNARVSGDEDIMNVPGNPGYGWRWLGEALRNVHDKTMRLRTEAVNEQLIPRAIETDPAIIGSVIQELERAGQHQQAAALRRQVFQRGATVAGSSIIGAPVALPGDR